MFNMSDMTVDNMVSGNGKDGRKDLGALLRTLGFSVRERDWALLDWALEQAECFVKYEVNADVCLNEICSPLLNLAAGRFLKAKKAADPDFFVGFEMKPNVKRIELGDTNTEFSIDGCLTNEQRIDVLIKYLLKSGERQLMRYRRLRW